MTTYNTWTSQFDAQIDGANLSPDTKTWVKTLVIGPNNGASSPGVPFTDTGAATFNTWTGEFVQCMNVHFPNNAGIWLKSLVVGPNGASGPGIPFADAPPAPPAPPAPSPGPIVQGANPPVMSGTPPSYVTNCPTLAFSDIFNEGANFQSTLSEWGPIVPPVKWITNKPDGLNFGGYYQPFNDGFSYDTSSGHLVLKMHNYYQAPGANAQGDGNWYTSALATAAWNKQTGGGPTTGFLANAPCYWETVVWPPPLTSCDVPDAAGLWPSISLYTDPQVQPTASSPTMELDLLEAYSINFKEPRFSWHLWGPSGQLSAGGSTPTTADVSQGWHKYGIWLDTETITYYMDDVQVFSVANPGGAGLEPFYFMLANGYGGGWTVSLTPSQQYNMHVAYVGCWTH